MKNDLKVEIGKNMGSACANANSLANMLCSLQDVQGVHKAVELERKLLRLWDELNKLADAI